jgi:nicotinamide-nucleotide amidase
VFGAETLTLAQAVLDACRARQWRLATAESCTGGLVAGALTAIAGSSDVIERGFVTYSNEAKSELLGVPPETIAAHGAISAETAAAMARGALARAPVDLAVSVTGIAGPGGATPTKPVASCSSAWHGATANAAPNAASSPATAPRCGKPPWTWRLD